MDSYKRKCREANEELIERLNDRIYWKPTLNVFKRRLEKIKKEKQISEKRALIVILDHLKEIMYRSSKGVGRIINKRFERGVINDKEQVRVAVAGNNFQALIAYGLARNMFLNSQILRH